MSWTQELGRQGEDVAARYLETHGLKLLERRFQTRWGEIDLVFREKDTVVFVEVKARTRAAQPSAADALTPAKQRKLVNAALSYMKKFRLNDDGMRFDVVLLEGHQIDWLPNAFEPSTHYTR